MRVFGQCEEAGEPGGNPAATGRACTHLKSNPQPRFSHYLVDSLETTFSLTPGHPPHIPGGVQLLKNTRTHTPKAQQHHLLARFKTAVETDLIGGLNVKMKAPLCLCGVCVCPRVCDITFDICCVRPAGDGGGRKE